MALLWKQAELMRTTSNYGVYYSMYLYKHCSLCELEILPCRFKGTSLPRSPPCFFSKSNFFLRRISFPTVMATEWNVLIRSSLWWFQVISLSLQVPHMERKLLQINEARMHESKQVWIEIMNFTAYHRKQIAFKDYSISSSISMATIGRPSYFPITTSWLCH